jgi:hypothetical protein
MDYWLDCIEELPKVTAVDLGLESVTVVGVHVPILSTSSSLLVSTLDSLSGEFR